MKYAIIKVVNGNYAIAEEGIATIAQAKSRFHGICQAHWNAQDVITAEIMIADENLDCVEGYKEYITHEPQPQEEQTEE